MSTPATASATAPDRVRVAIVDDHWMVRRMVTQMVADWPAGEVVLEAEHGVDYEERLAEAGPVHLAIVDLLMPERDGYATIAWIREHQPETRILAITFQPEPDQVHHALRAGAHGIMGKGFIPAELLAALEALRTTGHFANELMLQQLSHTPDPDSPMSLRKKLESELSPRELEFGKRYVSDDSPSRVEVAKAMDISAHTAEGYRRSLMEKTGVNTRLALLKCFLRFGVVKL